MNILIMNHDQFGYKAGYYHYSKHLIELGHKVVFLCRDKKLPKMSIQNVDVYYVESQGCIKWRIEFVKKMKFLANKYQFDVALCPHFKGCQIIKIGIPNIPVVIDIRSGYGIGSKIKRWIYDTLLKIEVESFKQIVVVSEQLAKRLGIKKYRIVTLGSDIISDVERDYNKIQMLYVGTLDNRNIGDTIRGVKMFKQKNPTIAINYDIVGFGSNQEESLIGELIAENNLSDAVVFHGRVNYDNLKPFFDKANIGIAYVPMTSYYDCQPATKIYEYALSGLYSIATKTYSNRILINDENGLLCDDNPLSFCECIEQYYRMEKGGLKKEKIQNSLAQYKWRNVVEYQLLPAFADAQKL